MSDDAALMRRAQRGDRTAFESVVRAHQGAVYGYLRARVAHPADAEDLTQEVFLRTFRGRKHYDPAQPLRPWLLGFARNTLREYVRLNRRRREVGYTEMCLELEETHCPAAGPLDDAAEQLPVCLESLGRSAREALALRYSRNLRLAQIGEKLHRSEGAIKVLIFRARQALKLCLKGRSSGGPHD